MSDAQPVHLLNQASGYGILVGVGALFAIGMILTTKLLEKYMREDSNSTEVFMVANRTVGTPLLASSVYLSWTWATELLWVCTMVYNYGIMASYWYAAGLAIQISLMALLGIEAKKKIPASHTSLEIVGLRYGKACHLLYMFLCLANNLLSCCSMIVGASGAISIIAGNLHIVASTMLIPFGVLLYTTVGGLKATFLTDFVHSFILLIILCYINTSIISSDKIGGLGNLYDLVIEKTSSRYIEGNYEGSFMTGKSKGAIFFGIILTIGNFGLTVMDSSFWQKSFSANVRASFPGYLLAGIFIFANVWGLGALVGLSSVVLEHDPIFPTYPREMTKSEVGSGFVLPYTVKALLGNGGVGAILLIIYLAVTSTVSAQMISVSSIVSFDIYRKYINPKAQNSTLIKVSHFGVVFFGLFSAGFSVMLHYIGVDMTWLGYFLSMIICPGVIPLVFTILWDRQTKLAAFASPVIGLIAGIVVWITTANHYEHEVTVASLGAQLPCMFGALTALFLPGILTIIISLTIKPYKFDWENLKTAALEVKQDASSQEALDTENSSTLENGETNNSEKLAINEKKGDFVVENNAINDRRIGDHNLTENDLSSDFKEEAQSPDNKKLLDKYSLAATISFFAFLLVTWVLWPLPLYRDWIWSKTYFKGYITVSFIWLYAALLVIGVYPLVDGRHTIMKIFRGIKRDFLSSKKESGNT